MAWAIVVLAGAVIFAAGLEPGGQFDTDGCAVGGIVGGLALLRLALFRYSSHPAAED